ncbi:unnamed protein product [Protopolystoma xenopodis]|uniref:Uncharacterized protein n=1 Tax=Protopolystoma xenopodis TaxID=117903 RepID=A0A448WMX3_9PLAT|nr:unnamed protein product [Protopolystoma xenopodis]
MKSRHEAKIASSQGTAGHPVDTAPPAPNLLQRESTNLQQIETAQSKTFRRHEGLPPKSQLTDTDESNALHRAGLLSTP